jgi:hypothetical protein
MFGPGVILQEFDPLTNTVSSATPPPDTGNPYPIGYLNLPTGQVMVTAANRDWIYTPDTPPDDSWRPVVSSVTYDSGSNTYTLTGTQITGLINGGDEGDDMTMSENYPIIWLKDTSGNVYYCRSFNFSTMMPSKGNTPETAQFTTPANLPMGTYDLYVSAVGVQSKDPVKFTVGMGGTGTGAGGTSAGGAGGTAGNGTAGNGGATTGTGGVGGSGTVGGGTVGGGGTIGGASNGTGGVSSTGVGGMNTGGAGGLSLVGTAGNSSTGSAGSNGTTTGSGGDDSKDSGGCSCSAAGSNSRSAGLGGLSALSLLGLLALGRRRRSS